MKRAWTGRDQLCVQTVCVRVGVGVGECTVVGVDHVTTLPVGHIGPWVAT